MVLRPFIVINLKDLQGLLKGYVVSSLIFIPFKTKEIVYFETSNINYPVTQHCIREMSYRCVNIRASVFSFTLSDMSTGLKTLNSGTKTNRNVAWFHDGFELEQFSTYNVHGT